MKNHSEVVLLVPRLMAAHRLRLIRSSDARHWYFLLCKLMTWKEERAHRRTLLTSQSCLCVQRKESSRFEKSLRPRTWHDEAKSSGGSRQWEKGKNLICINYTSCCGKPLQKSSFKVEFEESFQIRVWCSRLWTELHSLDGLAKQEESAWSLSQASISCTKNE